MAGNAQKATVAPTGPMLVIIQPLADTRANGEVAPLAAIPAATVQRFPRAAKLLRNLQPIGGVYPAKNLLEDRMKKTLSAAIVLLAATGFAAAQTTHAPIMSSPPPGKTVTKYYKQSVYDPAKDKIGTVDDVILGDNGQVTGLVIGVGGFLGAGEKDVAVAFDAVHAEMKDGAWYLTLDTTKDALKSAPGLTFDKEKMAWVPTKS